MEQQGWVKFYREWLDDPIICKDWEYFSIWAYLMLNATHKEKKVQFGGEIITLKAGQLLTSYREIEEKLKINRRKVEKVFGMLKKGTLIGTVTDMRKTLVTIELWGSLQTLDGDSERDTVGTVEGQYGDTEKETENEKEKRSKREKDKEKEINKNERMKENIYPPYIPPLGEKGREDFSLSSEKTLFSSDNRIVRVPQTEEELDRWLEEDDGIEEWDKMQIYYKNLNSGQQLAVSSQQPLNNPSTTYVVPLPLHKGGYARCQQDSYTEYDKTNGFDNTNPISEKNKVYNELHPHTPSSCEANHTEGVHGITQEACMESMQGMVWNQPSGCMDFTPVSKANPYPLSPDPCTMFDEFWQAYPKKVGKGYAFECFKKIKPSRKLLDTMLEAIKKQKKSDMWKRDKGQYIPNPSTWLNQKRWEDDLGGDDDGQIPWSEMKLPGTYL